MTHTRTFLRNLTLALTVFLPSLVFAQTAATTPAPSVSKLGAFLQQFITLIDNVLVPLVFAIAFIVFLFGIFQYFILGGANEEKRETGRTFMLYGIVGFFIMISVWGMVNLLLGTFNFGSSSTRPGLPTFGPSTSAPATGGAGSLPASDVAPVSGNGNGSIPASDTVGGSGANTSSDCRQNYNLCNGTNQTCSFATGSCVTTSSSGSGASPIHACHTSADCDAGYSCGTGTGGNQMCEAN
jgi:hypothetical protein